MSILFLKGNLVTVLMVIFLAKKVTTNKEFKTAARLVNIFEVLF
jgi:hypothetical protein